MPKLGLKCFAGSFVLSLAAVVAATKAYSVLAPKTVQPEIYYGIIEARNIELFTHTEESDPIAEKFNRLTATATEEQIHKVQQVVAAVERENTADDVLYTPEDAPLYAPEESTVLAAAPTELPSSETLTAMAEISTREQLNASMETSEIAPATDDIQIADASLEPQFMIPLKHNFSTATANVAVSSRAATNQVASTGNVNINNLGTDNKVAQTSDQPAAAPADNAPQSLTASLAAAQQLPATATAAPLDDDPWEVAEVANKNITRNANAEQPAPATGGNKVPYKMQENILIPIPDDIRKEKNLTPQISSSAENKKLEEELRRKHQQEAGIEPSAEDIEINSGTTAPATSGTSAAPAAAPATEAESEGVSDAESRSLSDSIAAWFSNTGKKASKPASEAPAAAGDKSSSNTPDNNTSLFRRLLGLSASNKDSNIAPTELKLAFQPNRAEISGQTLEWIRAFAENAVNYENTGIEVRIDRGGSYELQQKRLKLLYRLLTNHGVEYQKINIIFTDREPNSFIIRNVRYVPIEEKAKVAARKTGPWY